VWTGGHQPGPFDAVVQVRAHGGLAPARVVPRDDGVRVELCEPLRGVAPGQAAAFYVDDQVRGSATITATH
jgi:tRNA-specific 2-thiouridylase